MNVGVVSFYKISFITESEGKFCRENGNRRWLQFYEYLASGIPIVSTDLPDLKDFSKVASLVNTKEEFSYSLKHIIEKDNDRLMDSRMKLAEKYSWNHRLIQLNKNILKLF